MSRVICTFVHISSRAYGPDAHIPSVLSPGHLPDDTDLLPAVGDTVTLPVPDPQTGERRKYRVLLREWTFTGDLPRVEVQVTGPLPEPSRDAFDGDRVLDHER